MEYELSPCAYCCRVADPKNCDNKKCSTWQKWFLNRWEQTRKLFRASMDKATVQAAGVPLGGHHYPHPHRVREYLKDGPCTRCKIPNDLCTSPCPVRQVWERKKEALHELES